jgi:hypothetical protein
MGRPRKSTEGLSAEKLEALEKDRQRKAAALELERLTKAVASGDQDADAIRAMWAANLKSLDTKKKADLEAHQAEWTRIHRYLRNPFRLGEDIIDLVIDDVEEFIKTCPLSPGCGAGDTLSVYDQMLRDGILDELFNEFVLNQMSMYFKRYGLLLDYTSVREYRSFQTAVVRWYLRNKHRDAAEFGWDEDTWPKIEQYARSVPNFSQIRCCDRFDSSAPLCTANPTCWRLQTASTITPEPDTDQHPTRSPGAKEIALRKRLDRAAVDAQNKMTTAPAEPPPSLFLYGGGRHE